MFLERYDPLKQEMVCILAPDGSCNEALRPASVLPIRTRAKVTKAPPAAPWPPGGPPCQTPL